MRNIMASFGLLLVAGCGQPPISDLGSLSVVPRRMEIVVRAECGSAVCPYDGRGTVVTQDPDIARAELVRMATDLVADNPGTEGALSLAQRAMYGGGRYLPWDGHSSVSIVGNGASGSYYLNVVVVPEL